MERVGVRELRQNASVLLDRVVHDGATIEITNHGRPVARLVPVSTGEQSTRAELVDAGFLRPGRGDPLDVLPVRVPRGVRSTDDLLDEDRDDR
jgi:prevent-host-death family protein